MPRLKKGELAPGIRIISDATASSALARFKLMLAMKTRDDIADADVAPFKSFDALCRYSDESHGIFPISPKTLRKHVASNFEGGLEEFKKLMKWCGRAENQSADDNSQLLKTFAPSVAEATDAVLEITARYADLLDRISGLAAYLPAARAQLQAHFQIFPENAGHLRLIK